MTDPDAINPDPTPEPEQTPSAPSSDGAHLDGIEVEPEPGATAEGDDAGQQIGPVTAEGYLTPEAFHQGFCGCHMLLGQMLGLKSLELAARHETAGPAAQAIYDTALEVPALRWLIDPRLKWLQRVGAIAAFSIPVGAAVRMELAARKARPAGAGSTRRQPYPATPEEEAEERASYAAADSEVREAMQAEPHEDMGAV